MGGGAGVVSCARYISMPKALYYMGMGWKCGDEKKKSHWHVLVIERYKVQNETMPNAGYGPRHGWVRCIQHTHGLPERPTRRLH